MFGTCTEGAAFAVSSRFLVEEGAGAGSAVVVSEVLGFWGDASVGGVGGGADMLSSKEE